MMEGFTGHRAETTETGSSRVSSKISKTRLGQDTRRDLRCSLLVCLAGVLVSLNGCGEGNSIKSSTPPPQKIQHVVVLQENRTPDNLFPDAKLIAAGADIQNFGVNSKGTQITLTPAPLASDFNPDHSHSSLM